MIRRLWTSLAFRRWMLLLYWAVMFMATHWPDVDRYKPRTGWPFPHFDRVVHFSLYGGWVLMWCWVLWSNGRAVGRTAMVTLFVGGAAWGIFDELTQSLVAREPAFKDYLSDLAGLLAGLVVISFLQRRFSPPSSRVVRRA